MHLDAGTDAACRAAGSSMATSEATPSNEPSPTEGRCSTTAGITAVLKQVFFDLDVGDDPAFMATSKEAVLPAAHTLAF